MEANNPVSHNRSFMIANILGLDQEEREAEREHGEDENRNSNSNQQLKIERPDSEQELESHTNDETYTKGRVYCIIMLLKHTLINRIMYQNALRFKLWRY